MSAEEGLFGNIHDDPRWLPLLESIGASPEQELTPFCENEESSLTWASCQGTT